MVEIVVVGVDHHNTLGVIESLGRRGINSDVVIYSSKKWAYVLKSKYVRQGIICHNTQEVVSYLLSLVKEYPKKVPIIATSDDVAVILDKNYQALEEFFFLPNTVPSGSLSSKMSKEYMTSLARKVGLDVPRTWVVEDGTIPRNIEYPCITKAISSVEGSKDNIKVCKCERDLKHFLSNKTHCKTIQIQKYIEKEFEFQFLGCSLDRGNTIIIPGRTHIDRPNGMDNTFFLSFNTYEPELEEIVSKVKSFIKETGYSGPFSFEFLRDKNNGKNYFTEMNYRNDGNAVCVTKAGMNIPYIIYLYYSGKDYMEELNNSSIHQVYLLPEFYYFKRMLAGEFGFKEWLSNVKKADVCTTYFEDDKKTFAWFILQIFDHVLDRLRK